MNIEINIATDFSVTPGARYRSDGDYSGEEFYDSILETNFKQVLNSNGILTVNLDGTDGYATSFLDQAFGGLARKYTYKIVKNILKFISEEEPYLIEEIKSYMNEN